MVEVRRVKVPQLGVLQREGVRGFVNGRFLARAPDLGGGECLPRIGGENGGVQHLAVIIGQVQRQGAARGGGGDGTELSGDGDVPRAVADFFGCHIQPVGHQVEVGDFPQLDLTEQARARIPTGVGVAQMAADKHLVLAFVQRVGDVEPERRVAVFPLADLGAVDENGRIHVSPAKPEHTAGAGFGSDKEIFAIKQRAVAVKVICVADLPVVGQVDGGELRVLRWQLGIRRADGKQPVDAEISAFHKEQLLL